MKIAKNFECFKCGDNVRLKPSVIMQEGKTNFIIVGESPALDGWINSGRAFYNSEGNLQASGRVLARLLSILDITIDDIYFTECCKCVLKDRKCLTKSAQNCKQILERQLLQLPCDYILTMGKVPTEILLGKKIKRFCDVVGNVYQIQIGDKNFLLLPIYHPSPLNPKGYSGNEPVFKKYKDLLKIIYK